jgi:hypothetical protein
VTRKFSSKTAVAAAVLTLGATGSALFGGTAFAGSHGTGVVTGGSGGDGGKTYVNCVLPIGLSLGIIGQGGDNSQCNATGGAGGGGGTGANY